MNKIQKLINRKTKQYLEKEKLLFGVTNSFYKARKLVRGYLSTDLRNYLNKIEDSIPKSVFTYGNWLEDLDVWIKEETKEYCIATEGYVFFDTLTDLISYYKIMRDAFEKFLLETYPDFKDFKPTSTYDDKIKYEIDNSYKGHVAVFLDTYKSINIFDTYYWFRRVIEKLESEVI